MEEAKLKSKYPGMQRPGGSDFLRKRLQKGPKYFDSGDYNMAKQTGQLLRKPNNAGNGEKMPPPPARVPLTGDSIPTPEDLPQRKSSITASKLAAM
nr:PREDICTED: cAMP-regulated phosphoprotein 19-like isoform X2 [Saccoglossus kowalevskii]